MKSAIALARAKIMWGYEPSEVRRLLLEHKVAPKHADLLLAEFTAERIAEVRRAGRRRILVGSLLFFISVAYLVFRFSDTSTGMSMRAARGAGVIAFVGLYGLWKLIDGVFFITMPTSERRCITDISE